MQSMQNVSFVELPYVYYCLKSVSGGDAVFIDYKYMISCLLI